MVTGALVRNRKNKRNTNYQSENKVKILSGEDITLEKIYSRYNCGCLVALENFVRDGKMAVIHKINFEKRTIETAYSSGFSNKYIHWSIYKFNNVKLPSHNLDIDFGEINSSHYMYNELNRKVGELNKVLNKN